ncbi:MAG: hypothetical protein R6W31_19375 [Bacteroidales bacterium]
MKKLTLFILIGTLWFSCQAAGPSQVTDELVWFGIDYTLVKFIGTSDQFSDLPKIQSYYFRSWNELILAEKDKYDLNSAFSMATIHYNMENTILRSEQRVMDGIVQHNDYTIDEDQVKNVVSLNLDPSVNQVGAIFVMETLNKTEEISTMWLAVFNIASGEILYMRKYSGAVGGFGFRNYYAKSYYNVIQNLRVVPRNPAK